MADIYLSVLRQQGDFGAFFEADSESAYFYLVDMSNQEGTRIKSAVRIRDLSPNLAEESVTLNLSCTEEAVGLFIDGELRSVFEFGSQRSFENDPCSQQRIPLEISNLFY